MSDKSTLDDIRNELDTGDILLFHNDPSYHGLKDIFFTIFNKFISFFTHSRYTHSCIIVKDPNFGPKPLKGLYIFESSYEFFNDAEDGERKLGVELEDFDTFMESYQGDVYWRKLTTNRNTVFYETLKETHNVAHNRPYDVIPTDWLRAFVHMNKGNTQNTKRFWCSALVAFAYTKWGFLQKDTPWTLISPKQLGTEPQSSPLQFQKCTLAPEQLIRPAK
jgi:hypothetical protein